MKELHLFIIWSNASDWKRKILEDIETKFSILGIHSVTWQNKNFSQNLTRFYGENLPKNSNKERYCGNGTFTLIVIMDENPLYRERMTSKGVKNVNVNIFDSKEMYRSWTGGGHLIHGTNDIREVRHDLILLTGMSVEEYIKKYNDSGNMLNESFSKMPGEVSWKDAEELLHVLNETVEYVILRNFNGIFSVHGRDVHGDVDLLVKDMYNVKIILNAKPVHKSKYRVKHIVKIGEGGVFFDIRYIGDNYYCSRWEKEILKNRYCTEEGYYRTDKHNYKYSLLYHALVHKKAISLDYLEYLKQVFPEIIDSDIPEKILKIILNNFMEKNKYEYIEPKDYSVYYNPEIVKQGMSKKKFILKALHKIIR